VNQQLPENPDASRELPVGFMDSPGFAGMEQSKGNRESGGNQDFGQRYPWLKQHRAGEQPRRGAPVNWRLW